MIGAAIRDQSQRINKILRNVNTAVMTDSWKAVDIGEKAIMEYGYYRYHIYLCYCPIVKEIKYCFSHIFASPFFSLGSLMKINHIVVRKSMCWKVPFLITLSNKEYRLGHCFL
jgi:hypothetical protein